MCELLEDNFFRISPCVTNVQPLTEKYEIKDLKLLLEDSAFSPKIFRQNSNSFTDYRAIWTLRLSQNNINLLLEAHIHNTQFFIKVKNIHNLYPVSVNRKQLRKILLKQFSKKSYETLIEPYHSVLNMQNGQFYIKTPIYYIDFQTKQFNNRFYQLIEIMLKKLNQTLKNATRIFQLTQQQISSTKKSKIHQALRFLSRCTTAPSISIKSDCAEYQSVIHRYAASNCDMQDIVGYNKEAFKITTNYFKDLQIYGFDISKDNKIMYLDQISLRQKQKIQEEIRIPSYIVSKPKQNKYIFNVCYFLNTNYQQRKINQGGNSEIYVLRPQIYECSSNSCESQQIIQKSENISKYTVKHVIYKKNIQKDNMIINRQKQFANRQTEIISYLRGGSCLFLPKYYLNIEKNSIYGKKLFIEYLPGQTLNEFLSHNQETVSSFTKLYLVLQILQALRFVNSLGIVHLDIKQNNIIVLKKMICKIFDFAESYHYKVCGLNHKPKYTLLYASPQAVTSVHGRAFTQKSDIFSFGIMMHNIFFRKHPYYFADKESFEKSNFEQSLRNKTFFVPQQREQQGDQVVIQILNQLILKCVDMDEQKRPYLDWTTLVIKTCFSYLTSQ